MELAKHREEELGGPLGHLSELGVPEQLLNFSGSPQGRASNVVLQAATKTSTATGHQCYQKCMADSRLVPLDASCWRNPMLPCRC